MLAVPEYLVPLEQGDSFLTKYQAEIEKKVATMAKGAILVTGSNGSLGCAVVTQIVTTPELAGYYGLYTVRDSSSATGLQLALQRALPSNPHSHRILSLDLTDLENVRAVAATINESVATGSIPPIRAIILNAGYIEFTNQTWTKDGFDMTFASNYLGHWLLCLLLLESLDRDSGRIVVVGSESHEYVPS